MTEGRRRLRALVRAAMSGGIWLLIAVQIASAAAQLLLTNSPGSKESPTPSTLRQVMVIFGAIAVLYLQAGIYRGLVRGRDAVSIGETLRAGRDEFVRFLWLIAKAGALFVGVLFAALLVYHAVSDAEAGDTMRHLTGAVAGLALLTPFMLAWWLPWVFVRDEFRLFPSLKSAWILLWQRLSQTGFLAALLLLPAFVLWWLSGFVPVPVMLMLNAAALLLVWTASVYCVEWLTEPPQKPDIP